MIISPGRNYIFVHIPKTGGTAVALALESRARSDDILIGDTPKAQARRARVKALQASGKATGRLWKHSTLADIEGVLPPRALETMFTVTIVRNPWDRVVSYYFWLRAQGFAHPAVGLARTHDLAGFVDHPHTRASLAAWPYGAYMRDRSGVERCDLFARFENLPEDLAPLEAHLGLRLPPLPRVNMSDRDRDWRRYFDDATAVTVAETCAEDVARFGYRFDP